MNKNKILGVLSYIYIHQCIKGTYDIITRPEITGNPQPGLLINQTY